MNNTMNNMNNTMKKYRIHFDRFIDSVIFSQPSMEKLSLMQRYNFKNGYGENTLLMHIRILCRTLISESGHKSISYAMFQTLATSYKQVNDHDIELAYKVLDPEESKHISFRRLSAFFVDISLYSVTQIMRSLYKSKEPECVSYDFTDVVKHTFKSLRVEIPTVSEKSISTHNSNYSLNTPSSSPITHENGKSKESFCDRFWKCVLFMCNIKNKTK